MRMSSRLRNRSVSNLWVDFKKMMESLGQQPLAQPVEESGALMVAGVEEDINLRVRPVVAQGVQQNYGQPVQEHYREQVQERYGEPVQQNYEEPVEWDAVLGNNVRIKQPGTTPRDLGIDVYQPQGLEVVADEALDLDVIPQVEDLPPKVQVKVGEHEDVINLIKKRPAQKGVICDSKVLCWDEHMCSYEENQQYKIIPGTSMSGAYGKVQMCEDLISRKVYVKKTIHNFNFMNNEVEVPLKFKDVIGIPEVYGVILKEEEIEVFQECAGQSILKIWKEPSSFYAEQLRDPQRVLGLAYQAFSAMAIMHHYGVTHQDIKPENLCIDIGGGCWQLKFIDFGSSQMVGQIISQGLTWEYLSPESAIKQLQSAQLKKPEIGRLDTGNDVWAMGLSLLYCLCGYHPMVLLCTGRTSYVEKGEALEKKRIETLIKISQLIRYKEEDIMCRLFEQKFTKPSPFIKVLVYLLRNVLRINPKDRWNAKQARDFVSSVFQPKKAASQGPETSHQSSCAAEPPSASVLSRVAMRNAVVVEDSMQSEQSVGLASGMSPTSPMPPMSPMSPMSPAPIDMGEDASASSTSQLPHFNMLLAQPEQPTADLVHNVAHPFRASQRHAPYSFAGKGPRK